MPLTFLLESIETLPSDIEEEMGAVGKLDVLVQKYLKRTRRFKTLEEFEKSLVSKRKKGTAYNHNSE